MFKYLGYRGTVSSGNVNPDGQSRYTAPEMYDFERRAIFSCEWQTATSELSIQEPGDWVWYNIAGFNIVIARDRTGSTNAFHNVCRHGAYPVVEGDGRYNTRTLGFDKSKNRPFENHVHVDSKGLIWTSMDSREKPDVSWDLDFLGVEGQERLQPFDFRDYKLNHTYQIDADYNWKIAADNSNECYHCSATPPDIPPFLNLESFDSDLKDGHIQQNVASTQVQEFEGLSVHGFAILHKITTSKSALWNPDRNPVIKAVVKPLIYDHFCAGTHEGEIRQRVAGIRDLGFSGVILAYGKEVVVYDRSKCSNDAIPLVREHDEEIGLWEKGNLETIAMLEDKDFLAVKLTGAGIGVTNTMMHNGELPVQLDRAVDAIANAARQRNCRIIIDSEQQAVQKSIDEWTIRWMRKYNTQGEPLIYNTLQAYLKDSRSKLQHQLSLAQKEGWTLAIKLVRGAYINNDIRERIHDTKQDTDDCYNGIVQDVLKGTLPGFENDFPRMRIFIAGHNQESVDRATSLIETLSLRGELKTLPEFGQLQGMADELGCKLLHWNEQLRGTLPADRRMVEPRVYKYMTWGSVQECMEYLVRRAVENRGAADRMKEDIATMSKELRSRIAGVFW
ncbi:Proline dehydrogenase 1, mitochondrial [Sphaceloma murrayae]|uniref:Proline dehydrogenase n=1 Tax=Sphaceloma murrayae TaxID=2082308 RepID=A0A2K1QST7_9PEZI|nr:Proline dehydrogenase 1, mitochondrial [Sphaceloma murrayae]